MEDHLLDKANYTKGDCANRCTSWWYEIDALCNGTKCQDYRHNDQDEHCHDSKTGECRPMCDHNEVHCYECHDNADCRCFDPEG